MSVPQVIPLSERRLAFESRGAESPMARPKVCPYFDIKREREGKEYIEAYTRGITLMRFALTNKGTAFSLDERVALGLDGLLPTQICTQEEQIERAYRGYREQATPIAKYQFLRGLQERQEVLFYALVSRHLDEMLPIIYTPTVGEAVANFSALYQNARGLSIAPQNIDRIDAILRDYPLNDIRLIVATDSSAILGIGDQGYGGLAISIGKLALYTVGGGVSPFHTLPVTLDVGTDRSDLVTDPLYLGTRQLRLRGEEYLGFLDRFVEGIRRRWPQAVIQWEDLAKETAFTVLERYRDALPSFNDDIQGTGAVTLAGVLAACRRHGQSLSEQRFLISGAGAGGIGVAWALREGLKGEGLSEEEAAERLFVLDSRGLLLDDREMSAYKRPFARPAQTVRGWAFEGPAPNLLETVRQAGITVLIGLSGQPGSFTREVVEAAAANAPHPMIFPLSNPTSLTEARPEDIVQWTEGRASVATGSPFDAVAYNDRVIPIGQGNNAFIFPGLGFAAVLCGATRITDGMVLAAAHALADYTSARHLEDGRVYPPVSELNAVSQRVACAVIEQALDEGVATRTPAEADLEGYVERRFWRPKYLPIVAGGPKPL